MESIHAKPIRKQRRWLIVAFVLYDHVTSATALMPAPQDGH
jgi:hypothetical protein